ncbi:ATP-grasp fold amidoligase family protein [uncultured Brachyspira sp.]|uniref:rhamnan synthesis F family protein n=1 Tax=uncultured Brachyspira sp. TaxID=221953 RepID=UPI0025D21CD4|nr:ATP-grasp fold amidoligase family protein [uncultured Brachyspira sp.]
MKRLTLFIHHDKDNIIDDYVVYWLKYMNKLSDIIFVSNNNLSNTEIEKIKNLIVKYIMGEHRYFGEVSTIIGYKYAYENNLLENYDWIIIILDSIYGPFFDIKSYIEKQESKCICYGFTKAMVNTENEHIQGTFVSLPKKAFMSKEFSDFLLNFDYEKTKNKDDAVFNYEIAFSKLLRKLGFKLEGMFEDIDPLYTRYEPVRPAFIEMIKKGYPFIRRTIFTKNYFFIENLKDYLELKDIIPIECFNNMQKNLDRVVSKEDFYINLEYPEIRRNITYKQYLIDKKYREEYNYSIEFLEIKTFIEKLTWLKLNYHPKFIKEFSDRYFAIEYIKEKVEYNILLPMVEIYNDAVSVSFNLDLNKLPDKSLFCSSISNKKIFLDKSSNYDENKIKYDIFNLLNSFNNKYFDDFEWQFKYIQPRLFIYEDKYNIYNTGVLYKILCFENGEKFIKSIIQKDGKIYSNFYDINLNLLLVYRENINFDLKIPNYVNDMLEIATKLSNDINTFVSIDFIGNESNFYFDKFDFYSDELIHPIFNNEYDIKFGNLKRNS